MDWEQAVPERYRARYDSKGDRWLVLDTWHPQIKNVSDLTQDIPDDSPAIKIVSGAEINEIVGKMIKMGWMKNIIKSQGKSNIINKGSYDKKQFERDKYPTGREQQLIKDMERISSLVAEQKNDTDYRMHQTDALLKGLIMVSQGGR